MLYYLYTNLGLPVRALVESGEISAVFFGHGDKEKGKAVPTHVINRHGGYESLWAKIDEYNM